MKKRVLLASILILILLFSIIGIYSEFFSRLMGQAVSNPTENQNQESRIGPTEQEIVCMSSCMNCVSPGINCTGNSEQCIQQCNVNKPETTEETSCMEECVSEGCSEFDFSCQTNNRNKCEKECDMLGDKPDESEMSAEQLCIANCVSEIDSSLRCGASQQGETGGEVCQRCAESCVHLYEGPCLDDEKLNARKKECETCEHCYGEPIMGDSGEGWECIVTVECKDASGEFGDNPGTGPGLGQEGFIADVGDAIGNVIDSIGDFFSGIFGGEKE